MFNIYKFSRTSFLKVYIELTSVRLFYHRVRAGIRQLSQWLKKTKIGSRKIKLAQTYEKYDFLNTLRLHYNADSACSSIMCGKMSADDHGIHNASCENRTPCIS